MRVVEPHIRGGAVITDDPNRSADQAGCDNQSDDLDVTATQVDAVRMTTQTLSESAIPSGEQPDNAGEFDFRVLGWLVGFFGSSVSQRIEVSRFAAK